MNIKKIITSAAVLSLMAFSAAPTVQEFAPAVQPTAITASAAEALPSNSNDVYNYLKSHTTWNSAAICGIMAHLHTESRFQPTVVNSSSGAYGVAQWLGVRLTNLKKRSNYNTLYVQLQFLIDEINNESYYAPTKNAIRNAANSADGGYNVAYTMRLNYGWGNYNINNASSYQVSETRTAANKVYNLFWPRFGNSGGNNGGNDGGNNGGNDGGNQSSSGAEFGTLWVNNDIYIFNNTQTMYKDSACKNSAGKKIYSGQQKKFVSFCKSGNDTIGRTSDGYYIKVKTSNSLNVNAYGTVDCDCLNVRSGAGTNYGIVKTVYYGANFKFTKTSGDWAYAPNAGGWLNLNYIHG